MSLYTYCIPPSNRLEILNGDYFLRLQNAFDTLKAKRRITAQVAKIKSYKGA